MRSCFKLHPQQCAKNPFVHLYELSACLMGPVFTDNHIELATRLSGLSNPHLKDVNLSSSLKKKTKNFGTRYVKFNNDFIGRKETYHFMKIQRPYAIVLWTRNVLTHSTLKKMNCRSNKKGLTWKLGSSGARHV